MVVIMVEVKIAMHYANKTTTSKWTAVSSLLAHTLLRFIAPNFEANESRCWRLLDSQIESIKFCRTY